MTAWRTPYASDDGSAFVIAGEPAVLRLRLLEADGVTEQPTDGRSFLQRIVGRGGVVLAEAFADSPQNIGGKHYFVLSLDGAITATLLPAGKPVVALSHYVGEVIDGEPNWILANARFQVSRGPDPDTALPTSGSMVAEGPSTIFNITFPEPVSVDVVYLGAKGEPGQDGAVTGTLTAAQVSYDDALTMMGANDVQGAIAYLFNHLGSGGGGGGGGGSSPGTLSNDADNSGLLTFGVMN